MIRVLFVAICLTVLAASSASAGDQRPSWIFNQSYYSHNPVRPVQVGRQNAGGPVFTRPTGDYYQVGVRYLNSSIRVGPYTWDNVRVMESWTRNGSQY